MLQLRANRAALLASLAGLASLTTLANAQDQTWVGGAGNWSDPARWVSGNVPDTFSERGLINAPGSAVTMNATFNVGGIVLAGGNTLAILPGTSSRLSGDVSNDGVITLNSTGANAGTPLYLQSSISMLGSGTFALNANPANLDTGYIYWNGGGETLTNGAGHTIRGVGNLYTYLTNNGTVQADVNGATLQLLYQNKTNNSVMKAINGATLLLTTNLAQGPGATLSALGAGSTLSLSNSSVSGGTVSGLSGGVVNSANNTFADTTLTGNIRVLPSTTLAVGSAGVTNNGTITVNPTSANSNTVIRLNNSVTFAGSGDVFLNADPANLDSAYIYWNGGGEALTNASTHLIHGTGNIYTYLTNNGTVRADQASGSLQLTYQPKTNNSLFTAVNGANLAITGCGVTQVGGTVSAVGAGSAVTFSSAGLSGGNLVASGGGLVRIVNTTFDAVTMSGPAFVPAGTQMFLNSNGLINNGSITINETGANNGSYFRLNANTTISGSGSITLNANAANLDTAYITWNGGGESLTHAAGHTIRGTGDIYTYLVNNGTIQADVTGRTLQLIQQVKTNNSVMQAINGGNLQFLSTTLNQSGAGAVSASGSGSSLRFISSTINGGAISVGPSAAAGTNACAFNGITLTGTLKIDAGSLARSNSGLTNNGTIVVNNSAANSGTYFQAANTCTITGTGDILLNANAANLDTAYLNWNGGGEVLTIDTQQTVHGTGRVYVIVDNKGAIRADAPGKTLEIIAGNTKTNENLFQAENGATLAITSTTINQVGAGQIRAQGGSVSLSNCTVNGGSIFSNTNSDLVSINGTVTLNGNYAGAQMRINPGSSLRSSSGFTNAGSIVVNTSAAAAATTFISNSSLTVDGPGRFLLNADPANLDTAQLVWNGGGEVLTNGPQHTIAGTGRVYVRTTNQGTIGPGNGPDSIGTLDFRSIVNCAPSSVVDIEIGGPTPAEFDRCTGNATWNLDGAIRVSTANGYVPPYGTTYDVIFYGSHTGTFSEIQGQGFTVEYLPDRIRLVAVCVTDVNQDGVVDQGDVDYMIDVVAGGPNPTHINADINQDGVVDQGDVDAIINAVAGGDCN